MSPEELALFPFLAEASEYISSQEVTLEDLVTGRAFRIARSRGDERVMNSFFKEKTQESDEETDDRSEEEIPTFGSEGEVLSEILSYPYARILVSCLNEPAFTRRYALTEAKKASFILKRISNTDIDFLLDFGKDFGIEASENNGQVQIYFSDYIRYSLSMKDISWKLVNRHIDHGYITIRRDEFIRLMQEAIRKRIESSLPIPEIPDNIREACVAQVEELKAKYEEQRQNLGDADLGEVDFTMFPPCINKALANVREGVNLAHSMRFAMVSFLLNAGLPVDEVVNVFNVSPDFSEEKTRYQVEHIANNQYKTPSCATMQTYGNCFGKDNMCSKIRHPLGYYSALKFLAAKRKAEEEKYGTDEEPVAENVELENKLE